MPVFQIVLDFLKVLVWPLLVLVLFVILLRRIDIWLDKIVNAHKVSDEAPQESSQLPEYLQSGVSRELSRERKALEGARDTPSRERFKVLGQHASLVQDAGTDAIGLGLLQAGSPGLPIEGVLQKMMRGDNPSLNPRIFPISHLRATQTRAERLVGALQDIGLVTLENERYRLTPSGTRLFEKIHKDKTDFETKFFSAFSDSNTEATSGPGNRHTFAIQNGTDDASESPGDTPCPFSVSDENIYIGDCSPGQPITAGLRFANVDIPPLANIREAYVEFIADGPYSNLIATVIQAENNANPSTFSDLDRPRNRPTSPVTVPWRISTHEPWTLGHVHKSPDISPVLQAIVNRQGWQAGNALVILIAGTSGGDSGTHRRFIGFVRGTENTEYKPPRLVVEYSPPGGDSVFTESLDRN